MDLTLKEFETKVEIKPYLSLVQKKNFVTEVVSHALEVRDELYVVNYFVKELTINMCFLKYYTDFKTPDDFDYDKAYQLGIFDYVKSKIIELNGDSDELSLLKDLIEDSLYQEVEVHNSLSGVIVKKANEVINVIPDKKTFNRLFSKMVNALNKVKPEVIEAASKEFFNGNLMSILKDKKNLKTKENGNGI